MQKNCAAVFVLALLSALAMARPLAAQQADDSLSVALFKKEVDEKYRADGADATLHLLAKREQEFAARDALGSWFAVQSKRGLILAENGHPFEALQMMRDSMTAALSRRPPKSRHEYVQCCFLYLDQAFICKTYTEDFVQAKNVLSKAYQIFTRRIGREDAIARFLYVQYGNTLVRLGERDGAAAMFEEGIDYAKKYQSPDAATFNDYASMYIDADYPDYDLGLELLEQGIQFPGMSARNLAFLYTTKSDCLARKGLFDEAVKANRIAEQHIAGMKKGSRSVGLAKYYVLQNSATIASRQKHFSEAEAWLDSTLVFGEPYFGGANTRQLAFCHIDFGNLYLAWGKPEKAMPHFQQTLRTVVSKAPADPAALLPDSLLRAEKALIGALEGKALCFQALGQPEKALAFYERIPAVEARLRATHDYESSSLQGLRESRRRLEVGVGLAWQLYRQTKDDAYRERAFRLTEQARGALLLRSLATAQAAYQLDSTTRARERELQSKIAWVEQQLAEEEEANEKADSAKIRQWRNEQLRLKQEQADFQVQLRILFPDYANLLDSIHLVSSAEVPALLRSDQAMLDYFLTDSFAYIFYFDKKGNTRWRCDTLPPEFLPRTVERMVKYLSSGRSEVDSSDQWFRRQAYALERQLLEPELKQAPSAVKSLVIIPDGALAFVPFEALLRKPGTAEMAWAELHYLLNDFAIAYAYSPTLLGLQQDKKRRPALPARIPFAGFAPIYRQARDPQGKGILSDVPMPAMQAGVRRLQHLLGGRAILGEQAVEDTFRLVAPDCRILLLALHGFADEEKPALSHLVFHHPLKDATPDNVLYANELIPLKADLVVLNACYTGFGRQYKGEGVYSLARAFTAAGVPSSVISVWQLDANASPFIMDLFFHYLKDEGMEKDKALQQARLDFLKNKPRLAHPTYWSGILATGDMSALKF